MRPIRERWTAVAAAWILHAGIIAADPAGGGKTPLAVPGIRKDQPITVSAAMLEYDYKQNVVVYRGNVQAAQGDVHLRSDELTIRLARAEGSNGDDPPTASLGGRVQLREIVAAGHVRIDQGERWATGGRAVFDQDRRILVLSEDPVLHDGPNQIAGDRVVVYLDEDRSVVEGGEKRVKAVLFPGRNEPRPERPSTP